MRHLFSPEGKQALQAVMQREPLLAFDFDGTLAPIVARPHDARVPANAARLLARIARRRPVAIVTGRRVEDVAARLGFKPHYIVGNHGAEDPGGRLSAGCNAALDGLRRRIAAHAEALRAAGVTVEDKGQSLALHYRLAPSRTAAVATIDALLAELDPALTSFGGKCVANIVPADAPDKGEAVASLVARSGSGSALFIGDDVNDETVFARAEPHWLTVRVGRDDPLSRAQFCLDNHSEVAVLLQKMNALLEAGPGR
jgi:trehalose 6-phosphate phosphatase